MVCFVLFFFIDFSLLGRLTETQGLFFPLLPTHSYSFLLPKRLPSFACEEELGRTCCVTWQVTRLSIQGGHPVLHWPVGKQFRCIWACRFRSQVNSLNMFAQLWVISQRGHSRGIKDWEHARTSYPQWQVDLEAACKLWSQAVVGCGVGSSACPDLRVFKGWVWVVILVVPIL